MISKYINFKLTDNRPYYKQIVTGIILSITTLLKIFMILFIIAYLYLIGAIFESAPAINVQFNDVIMVFSAIACFGIIVYAWEWANCE